MSSPQTLYEKIWHAHLVEAPTSDTPGVMYIDLHLIHEVTSPQAFQVLRERNLKVRRPDKTVATTDHSTPTLPKLSNGKYPFADSLAESQVLQLEKNCAEFGIRLFGLGHRNQGIVHVMGPELGLTHPGMTIVCGDSHTSTHGAFGALAFGIGTTEVGYTLATQCIPQQKAKTMAINISGSLQPGVTAKDLILAIIAHIGVGGGTGHVIEYRGECIQALDMEARMTICNMSIEAGARAGLIAPDHITFDYLRNKPYAPQNFDAAVKQWSQLYSDPDAVFDTTVEFDASRVEPMITYGTHPGMGCGVTEALPNDTHNVELQEALAYMQLKPGVSAIGTPVQVVFIGSCTNSRITDLRCAAEIMKNRKVAPGVRVLVVPGSQQVAAQAQAEKLDVIFKEAGAEWREPGCSMCIAMNGDMLQPGELAVSTSNRNFKGRQGSGSRTVLASPYLAAAAAIAGTIQDPRDYLR